MSKAPQVTGDEAKQQVVKLIDEIKIAQLITCSADGQLHARPMVAQSKSLEGEYWFYAARDSRKVAEIRKDQTVLLSYAHTGRHDYLSISGTAEIVDDKVKIHALWNEGAAMWFEGADDPRIILICMQAETAEYWDSHTNVLVYAYSYLKSKITHEPATGLGESGRADYRAVS